MANNDVEIEIKVSLNKKQFSDVRKRLEKISKFIKKISQVDEYFTPEHRHFLDVEYPYEWLRIGKRSNKIILNYKHYYPENKDITTYADEFETEVLNENGLRKLFKAIDIKSLVIVDKTREVYEYKDEFEISLDNVKDLGYFIEIEAIKDFGSVEKTRKKILEFAKKLGIENLELDKRGYPYLLMQKRGLIK